MRKEEVITGIFSFISATGKQDLIQEITEQATVQRNGEPKQWEKQSYRRVSDRADVSRLSEKEFQVVTTGEKITAI